MPRSPWSRWSRLSSVERVDAYTRQSLFVLLHGTPGIVLLSAAGDLEGGAVGTTTAVGLAVVVTLVAGWVMRAVLDLHPAPGPVPWRRIAVLLAVDVAVVLATRPIDPDAGLLGTVTAWGVTVLALVGLTDRRLTAAVLLVGVAVPLALTREPWTGVVAAATGLFLLFTVRASLWLLDIVVELDRARAAQGELAVAEERLRFARDVHDVLGRHLSSIAVQAELASRLSERGDERAATQMLEVRQHAHDALREARELARGYRETTLERELEGARSLLEAAGITTSVEVSGLPAHWHEATAWVVRETVTNVLRHSRATHVTITGTEEELTVRNDGSAASGGTGDGSGLAGLRDRLAPLGARLDAAHEGEDFVVRVALPARVVA